MDRGENVNCIERNFTLTKYFRAASPAQLQMDEDDVGPSDASTSESVSTVSTSCDYASRDSSAMDDTVNVNDVGLIIKESMSNDEVSHAVSALSPGQKYAILTEHYVPGKSFSFPKIYNNDCYRSFQRKWLDKYPWLVYSKERDGGFCKLCALFATKLSRCTLGVLVNRPFTTWVKVHKIVEGHASNKYHMDAVEDALAFKRSIEQPQVNVDVRLNMALFNAIQENRHIFKCYVQSILFCGRQCIALRGDNERLNQPRNPGNFLSMLKVIACYDPILKAHLEKQLLKMPLTSRLKYKMKLLTSLEKIIQKTILEQVRCAQCFSVMVDEVTSHNQELMPLCVRFVHDNKCIREEFLQFSTLVRVTGVAIATRICTDLQNLDLDVKKIRGQGYDGASICLVNVSEYKHTSGSNHY